MLEQLGLYDQAVAYATKHLTLLGRDGEHYRAALELLDEIEQAKTAAAAAEAARKKAEATIAGMEFLWVSAGADPSGVLAVHDDAQLIG